MSSIHPLQSVWEYENPRIVNKFRTVYDVSETEAVEIFRELKSWLWLCAQHKKAQLDGGLLDHRPLVIHVSMVIIDEMWHTFLLHTEDYADFCDHYFGFFIHHSPASPDFVPLTESETRRQLEYIWDKLGGETVLRWYDEFGERFSPDKLLKLLRPPVFGRPCERR